MHHPLNPSVAAVSAGLFAHCTHGMSQSCFVHKEPLGAAFLRRGQFEFYELSSTSANVDKT